MATDLITLEVLRNKFDVIADEMDASAALVTPARETIAQAASIPIHLGSLVPAVQP